MLNSKVYNKEDTIQNHWEETQVPKNEKCINLTVKQMEKRWLFIANAVHRMYKYNLRLKEGIG